VPVAESVRVGAEGDQHPGDVDPVVRRGALEGIRCRRVVATATDEGLDRLDETVERTAAALERSDRSAAVESNAAFHEVLIELADSPVLRAVMEPVAGPDEVAAEPARGPAAMNEPPRRHCGGARARDVTRAKRLGGEHLAASRRAMADSAR
jgi:DNA-binding GntR family transcriptional regulator